MNATDGSGANCHMSSVGMCSLLCRRGYAMVMQVSARDRNRIAIQGDVLGAAAMGVASILCLTGDGVDVGDHPAGQAGLRPGQPVDAEHGSRHARRVAVPERAQADRAAPGVFSAPRRILSRRRWITARIGWQRKSRPARSSCRPSTVSTWRCSSATWRRCATPGPTRRSSSWRGRGSAGLGPLGPNGFAATSPGVHIPDAVVRRLKGAQNQQREGVNICIDMIRQIREIQGVHGIHIMAYRQEHRVAEIVERSGVLDGRRPWRPALDWKNAEWDRGHPSVPNAPTRQAVERVS